MKLGTSARTFVLVEWSDAGETSRERPIAPLHLHRDEDEAWYVLEGKLGFRVGDDEVEAAPGEAVFVPRGTPHSYWNAGDGRTRYLLVMGPRTAELVEAVHQPGAADFAALFAEHDSELFV